MSRDTSAEDNTGAEMVYALRRIADALEALAAGAEHPNDHGEPIHPEPDWYFKTTACGAIDHDFAALHPTRLYCRKCGTTKAV